MSEHTKEPWQQEPQDGHLVFDADHGVIADCDSPDDARRIVACVNACAGLTTEFLEAQDLSFAPAHTAAKMTEIELERDHLLAALKKSRLALAAASSRAPEFIADYEGHRRRGAAMKPHIYRHAGHWYCRRDYEQQWNRYIRQCGIASYSPVEAYRRAADYHQWEASP